LNFLEINTLIPERYFILLVVVTKILLMYNSKEKRYGILGQRLAGMLQKTLIVESRSVQWFDVYRSAASATIVR